MREFPPIEPPDGSATAWVSVDEAAQHACVDTDTVRRWYRSGWIPTRPAPGERDSFLVPLHAVVALAHTSPEGEDRGAVAADDPDGRHRAQLEAAREEATAARNDLARARSELVDARSELAAVHDQLGFLRSQLAEASAEARAAGNEIAAVTEERDRLQRENEHLRYETARLRLELEGAVEELGDHRARLAGSEQELDKLRRITSATTSITDNSWLDLPTNSYRSPVRPQGMTPSDGISGLLAATQADDAASPEAGAEAAGAEAAGDDDEPVTAAPEAAPPLESDDGGAGGRGFVGFGRSEDDLLPQPQRKGRRGRK